MGCLWGLALPLFFFCWEVGVSGSSAGPSTRRADTAMTTDDTEVPAMTLAPGHAALETQTLSAETSSRASTPAGPIPEAETRGAKRISPARETRSFTKTSPNFMVLIATSVETSAASGSPEGAGMTTVQTITGSDPEEAIFDTLCTDDSSEEAKTLTMDILTLAHTSTEAKGLSSESSASSDGPHPVITPSRASESSASSDGPHPVITPSRASESSASSDGPHPVITPSWSPGSDVTLLAEALVTVTNIEVINCSITEIETTTSSIPGASDIDLIPTEGVKASSTSDPPALPDSTEAKPHITEVTASAETLSTAGTTESAAPHATVGTPLPTNSATEREVTAPGATTLSGALVTVSRNPLEETSALSVETPSYVKVSGAAPVSIEAGSAVGKTTSFAGSSASSYSPSEAALKNFTPSETPTMDIATKGPFPTSRDPLPSVPPTTTNSSRGTNSTLAKITTSAKTTMKPPTATPTTARTRPTTDVSAGENGGFLLLRLSVASPEDLTDPRVAERLMQQLHRELHAHAPHFQVSLLRVRRG
ncbi:mucin-20 isoform b precursor [Homo sapiens]|uniref:Mucin 20, cell surface associated n=2 Tax=Homo sapiens TaxID=9606 RepID=A0A0G2JSE2_HUMAN|nr:mucin-20 isoform b precursor [Homo sapiens]AAH44243.1 MUC20 protein [Homo sapiens]|eukprot:NP_689886.3 mucin-20 isoform b precursor [Homo sapiens]